MNETIFTYAPSTSPPLDVDTCAVGNEQYVLCQKRENALVNPA